MSEWVATKLSDVVDVRVSNVDKKSVDGEVPVRLCNYMDVYASNSVCDSTAFMRATATRAEIERFGLLAGDVVITKDSESPDDIAVPTYVSEVGADVVCGYHLAILRSRGGIDGRFLSYLLRDKAVNGYFARRATGSTRYGLSIGVIKEAPIFIPRCKEEQRRIADLLSAVDEQIEAVTLQAKKQEEVCRAAETDLLRRIVQTAEKRQIGSFAKVGGGKRLPAGHEYSQLPTALRYLRVTDFFKQTVDYHSLQSLHTETFHALRRYELQPGDLYISIAGSIGWAGVMPKLDAHRVILTENAARIQLKDEAVNPEYLALFINSLLGQQQIEERIGTGGGVPKLALERIRTIQVAFPDEEQQRNVARFIGELREGVRALRTEQAKLLLLKQGLARQLLMPESPATEVGSTAN